MAIYGSSPYGAYLYGPPPLPSYETMRATGKGKAVYWLRIGGIDYVPCTEDLEPHVDDAWYWDPGPAAKFSGVKPWLTWGQAAIDERISFIDGTLDVEPIPFEITDIDGEFTAMVKGWHRRTMTRLRVSLDQGDVTGVQVESTAGFNAVAGVCYIGLEAIKYVGTDADTLGTASVERGYYGSIDTDHVVNTTTEPPTYPAVLDGPQILAGRRADVYAAQYDDTNGVVSTSECVFRGFIASDIESGEGRARLQVDHISRLWSREIAIGCPEVPIKRGYWYSGSDHVRSLSSVYMTETDTGTGVRTDSPAVIAGPAFQDTSVGLRNAAMVAVEAAAGSFFRWVSVSWEPESGKSVIWAEADASHQIEIVIRRGDYLWALGFDEGQWILTADSVNPVYLRAQRDPVPFVLECPDALVTSDDATIEVSSAGNLVDGQPVCLGQNPYVVIDGIAGDVVTIKNDSLDDLYRHRFGATEDTTPYIAIEETDDLVARHVVRWTGQVMQDTIERCFGLDGIHPRSWIVQNFISDDFEFSELDDCLIGVPDRLQLCWTTARDPIPASEIICDRLGVLGIAPRLTTEGRIGFARLRTPHPTRCNDVELDSEVWEHESAGGVGTLYEGEPLLNEILADHSYNYLSGAWAKGDTRLVYDDGISVLGKVRAKRYMLRGVHVSDTGEGISYPDRWELLNDIKLTAVGMHFGVYGRISPMSLIGATWTSRQHELDCGEMVLLTHPCVVDVAEGDVGVTSRVAIVVGRRNSLTTKEKDQIQVLLPIVSNVGPIAPCALGMVWNAGTFTLTFPSINLYAQAGEDDLTHFDVGHSVTFTEYDDTTPLTFGPSTIQSKGINSVVLNADPFTAFGGFPATGVWMHWRSYDNCSTDQKAWLFFADTTYGLGAAPDSGNVWGL